MLGNKRMPQVWRGAKHSPTTMGGASAPSEKSRWPSFLSAHGARPLPTAEWRVRSFTGRRAGTRRSVSQRKSKKTQIIILIATGKKSLR